MSDLNKLFDQFPDYDVFTGKTKAPKKRKRIQPNAPVSPRKRPPERRPEAPRSVYEEPSPRPRTDYGDGFGKADKPVKIRSASGSNALTLFYFPILILWLEITLRLACSEDFALESMLYLLGFSLPISFALTLICTFGGNIFNRVLCNIFTFIITGFFFFEILYFSLYKGFLSFSNANPVSAQQLAGAVNDKKFYLIALIIPLLVNLLFGHRIFGFRKFKISAKIALLAVAVLIQLIAINVVNVSREAASPVTSYSLYHSFAPDISVQERFGLLTMERLSVTAPK